ncbi:MAG TPA: Ig-like domain-containing protein [Longimicrobium sp.]
MMPSLRRLLAAAVVAAAMFAPSQGDAQRVVRVPPLYPTSPPRVIGLGTVDTTGLQFRVSQGRVLGTAALPATQGERISALEAARVLARARPLAPDSAARDSFHFPAQTMPAPRAGATVVTGFPSRDTAGSVPVPRMGTGALTVTRRAPEGEVPLGAEVTIAFSQPMVPLSSVGNVEARAVPARLSPQAPGRWQWIDVRTLRFEPQGRLPMATEFTVEIPAGTTSATGGRLAEAVRWTFATPAPRATGGWPYGGATGLRPVIVARFDQNVNPAAVLASVVVQAGGARVPVRMATASEVEADADAQARVRGLEAGRWIAFRPVNPLPNNVEVTVTIAPGTPSAEGPRRTVDTQVWSFRTFGPFRFVRGNCGYGGLCRPGMPFVLEFSNPLADSLFDASLVRVEPAIEGMRIAPQGNSLMIMGRTRPNTRYTVRVDAGLRDRFGQRLAGPATASFQVGAPVAQLWSANNMVVLDPQGPRSVSVFARGHQRLRVRVLRVAPEDWLTFGQRGGRERGEPMRLPGREVSSRLVQPGGQPGDTREVAVDLTPALDGGLGQVVVAVEAVEGATAGERNQGVYLWVQATRIGLTAFGDMTDLTAWTSSLVDGRPLPGVEVRLHPAGAAATTGADGLATMGLPSGTERSLIVARSGGDVAILAPGMGNAGWVHLGRQPEQAHTAWYTFTDRNLYRPGETVRFKGWARRMSFGKDGALTLPGRGAVDYLVRDSRGNEIGKGTAQLTELGGFDASFVVPQGANLGHASIQVSLAGSPNDSHGFSFLMQEFRRPEYEVSVTADEGPHFVGGGAEVVARASYFSGGGLPGAPVEWRVTAAPGFFSPPGWDEWSFGPTRPWWWWMDGDDDGEEDETFSGVTDASGAHAIRLDFDRAVPPRPFQVTAYATVTDVNRQTWTSSASLLVHPSAVYLGMRTPRSWLEAGDTMELEMIAVGLDGKPVTGRTIDVRIRRNEWRFDDGRWREVEAGSEACSRVSGTTPVRCTFRVVGGDYRIEGVTTDAQGRRTFTTLRMWVAGPGVRFPGRGEENEARRVEMIPDRERYAVGDTARILLRLPFQPARGVVTIGRNGIVRTEPLATEGATHTLRIPITEADVPNVWVQVDVTGATSGGTEELPTARGVDMAAGTVMLRVPPLTRTLTVRAVPSDSTMLPDAEGSVEVEVRDAGGRPVAGAEVAVVVVDEAVLALSGYRIPDPLALFYPERAPGINTLHLRPLVRVVAPDFAPAPGTLVGRVVNVQTGEPVGGTRVSVQGSGLSAVADAQGRFRIRGVPQGTLTLITMQEGYDGASQTVRVGTDATAPLVLYLVSEQVRREEAMADRAGNGVVYERLTATGAAASAPMPVSAPPPPPPPPPVEAPMLQGRATGIMLRGLSPGKPTTIAVRTNFDPLAVWMAAVRTDAQGRVRVPFKIPSNLTRYRVTAVAVEGATRFGLGESAITARQPLMVRPSPPRFLNFGDRFELPVVLQNTTGAPMVVQVAARAVGVSFTDPGRRVTIPARDRVEVRLAAEAVQAGQARFQVVAAGADGATDAAEFSLPVYTPATAEAFATYGNLAQGAATLPLDVPMDVIPSFGGLEVTTSSTALSELTDAFLYLVSYRYEGTEQIASRMIAVAALRDVLGAVNAEGLPSADSLRASVASDVRLLAARQNGDGGFAWWQRGRESAPYASIHAAHALQRVREAGYDVPAEVFNRARSYLRAIPGNLPRAYPADARRALHAYALYTRRRMGDDVSGDVRRLVTEAGGVNQLQLETAGWLLSATAGERGPAAVRDSLLTLVNNRATETATTATFATRYTEGEYLLLHSSRRTDAVVLEGLLAADPRNELVAKTVRGLLGNRVRGRWSNTQENAWVLLAVQRYFREYEAQTPDFVARVWLGDRLAGSAPFRGRSATRAQTEIPMRVLQQLRPPSLTVGMEGTGRLYYRAGLRYAPQDLVLTPMQRGFAVERTYEAVDSAGDVSRGEDGIWRVRAGARIRVTVTMTAPSRRLHVALVDPLPAGWEPVNNELLGAQPQGRGDEGPVRPMGPVERALMTGRGYWGGSWWEHQNLRDDRAEAFTSLLPAGVYTYTYVARATTPGLFIVPPPRAEEMYSPETFGRGGTDRVIVR